MAKIILIYVYSERLANLYDVILLWIGLFVTACDGMCMGVKQNLHDVWNSLYVSLATVCFVLGFFFIISLEFQGEIRFHSDQITNPLYCLV